MTRRLRILLPALVVTACQIPPAAEVASPVQEQMFAHFAVARDLRSLAVVGDRERVRVTAEELLSQEPSWGMPPGSDTYRKRVHDAAERAASAEDAAGAAMAVAELAAACGSCHLANDGTLGGRFQVAAPLMDDPATRHTNYLSWVSRLLWDGLVGPSEAMWRTGADALARGEGVPAPRANFEPEAEVARAAGILRNLGTEAVAAVDTDQRVRILGELWAECAGCHLNAGLP